MQLGTCLGVWVNRAEGRAPIRSIVVDDDTDFRMLVKIWMERVSPARYKVVGEAGTGEECIALVERLNPDLVLLDLTMPRMDGEQTFNELRRLRPDVRVVLMSGFNAHEAMLRFKGRGLASFLQKPFTIAALRTNIQAVLDTKGSAGEGATVESPETVLIIDDEQMVREVCKRQPEPGDGPDTDSVTRRHPVHQSVAQAVR